MKKILLILLMAVLTLSFIACGKPSSDSSEEQSQSSTGGGNPPPTTYEVTFIQEGKEDVVITVKEGNGISQSKIPTIDPVKGYNVAWSVTDFSQIASDMTVTVVKTPKKYSITYEVNCGCSHQTDPDSLIVTYGSAFELVDGVETCEHNFKYWSLTKNGEKFDCSIYEFDYSITVYAVFEETTEQY